MRPELPLAALACGLASAAAAQTGVLERMEGVYVGTATVEEPPGTTTEERDIDVVISPRDDGGVSVDWTNVSRVDGRRDVPGVKLRRNSLELSPGDAPGFLVPSRGYDPFREASELRPLSGDPVNWGSVDERGFSVFSFVILPDGQYELQVYDRTLTEDGIALEFEQILDGEVLKRIRGQAVRAE